MKWFWLLTLVGCRGIGLVPVFDSGSLCPVATRECHTSVGAGLETCQPDGTWANCTAPQIGPEICGDGLDNDVDGQIDVLPIEFCYSADPATLAFGDCRPGVKRCVGKQILCVGEKVPTPEICDGKSNNCDSGNLIDEGVAVGADVVVIVDNSGSMQVHMPVIRRVLSQLALNRPALRYALVAAPATRALDPNLDGVPRLVTNFVDTGPFTMALSTQDGMTGAGNEATLDALSMVYRLDNPLNLMWGPGRQRLVAVFTDENPQSYFGARREDYFDEYFVVFTLLVEQQGWIDEGASVRSLESPQTFGDDLDSAGCGTP